jgi:hypothetical protein
MASEPTSAGPEDEPAVKPPSRSDPEHDAGEDRAEPEPTDAPGPRGNPAIDEEALRHRQQERDRRSG